MPAANILFQSSIDESRSIRAIIKWLSKNGHGGLDNEELVEIIREIFNYHNIPVIVDLIEASQLDWQTNLLDTANDQGRDVIPQVIHTTEKGNVTLRADIRGYLRLEVRQAGLPMAFLAIGAWDYLSQQWKRVDVSRFDDWASQAQMILGEPIAL